MNLLKLQYEEKVKSDRSVGSSNRQNKSELENLQGGKRGKVGKWPKPGSSNNQRAKGSPDHLHRHSLVTLQIMKDLKTTKLHVECGMIFFFSFKK